MDGEFWRIETSGEARVENGEKNVFGSNGRDAERKTTKDGGRDDGEKETNKQMDTEVEVGRGGKRGGSKGGILNSWMIKTGPGEMEEREESGVEALKVDCGRREVDSGRDAALGLAGNRARRVELS